MVTMTMAAMSAKQITITKAAIRSASDFVVSVQNETLSASFCAMDTPALKMSDGLKPAPPADAES